jgi:hypothetical protein
MASTRSLQISTGNANLANAFRDQVLSHENLHNATAPEKLSEVNVSLEEEAKWSQGDVLTQKKNILFLRLRTVGTNPNVPMDDRHTPRQALNEVH